MFAYRASRAAAGGETERRFILFFGLICCLVALALLHEVIGRTGLLWAEDSTASSVFDVILHSSLFLVVCAASPLFIREMRRRRTSAASAQQAKSQIESLFTMTDMLQSALGHGDANSVLRSTASALLPGFGGALYTFNNSGDRLELSTSWRWPDHAPLQDFVSPSDCWAIKRGKPHLNLVEGNGLCCDHHQAELTALEIPMMARGEVYGLLIVERGGHDAAEELAGIGETAVALSDAMSLSLSNLALRERLRTQALRDALTGLYNRRYMEDALERHADQARRTHSPLSIIMIDLDHFKALNDQHGHAMGDAVLAETAATILGAVRPCDIACRYGGEELVVIMPDCTLEDAAERAEVLRTRIERLSERHGTSISASFGVSAFPDTSKSKDMVADADKALYRAKQAGRNRVIACSRSIREVPAKQESKAA